MTLTNSNLFTDSYNQLKNFLNTNISDPRNRFKKQWIHASLPNITAKGFDGYPFIVITVDVSENEKSLDRSTSQKVFRILLDIYSDEATDVDAIADEIFSKFKSKTLTDNMADFKSIEMSASPFEYQVLNGKKIHRRSFGIRGLKRI